MLKDFFELILAAKDETKPSKILLNIYIFTEWL
ncbi:hypothetical protein PI23P_08230 [Polaribacter irgensii 23-P]|uniref:Uncharacterized protein n=1 Tax=Polaribacter irgensii 23-P TaxID=313594 RepID=A4BZK5_9FLAO|nr:hypothetical protein PI23P_08230 [Polaribacter irgensii 23-P]